jgi:hypothetical protein
MFAISLSLLSGWRGGPSVGIGHTERSQSLLPRSHRGSRMMHAMHGILLPVHLLNCALYEVRETDRCAVGWLVGGLGCLAGCCLRCRSGWLECRVSSVEWIFVGGSAVFVVCVSKQFVFFFLFIATWHLPGPRVVNVIDGPVHLRSSQYSASKTERCQTEEEVGSLWYVLTFLSLH